MNRVPRVVTDPAEIREKWLSPAAMLHYALKSRDTGRPVLIAVSMAAGKSMAIGHFLAAGVWRRDFDIVVVFVANRKQGHELVGKLTALDLKAELYPKITEIDCPHEKEIEALGRQVCGRLARRQFCEGCPKRDSCRHLLRLKPKWAEKLEIAVVPEQLLGVVFAYVRMVMPDKRVLVINDEAQMCVQGFFASFSLNAVQRESDLAMDVGAFETAGLLARLLADPEADLAAHLTDKVDEEWKRRVIFWQEQGVEQFGSSYRFTLPVILDYVAARSWRWYENGQFRINRPPGLGDAQIFMGANLQPALLQQRYGTQPFFQVLRDVHLQNPETQLVNIKGPTGVGRRRKHYVRAIINLCADILARQHEAGGSTVLLGRKDQSDDHVEDHSDE